MKKSSSLFAICCVVLFTMVSQSYSFDIFALHDNLYIKSIDSLRINESSDSSLRIIMTLQNDSEKTIRVKNGKFKIFINPNKEYQLDRYQKQLDAANKLLPQNKLELGDAQIAVGNDDTSFYASLVSSFEIETKKSKTAIFEIPLPRLSSDRYQLVLKIMNFIGLPGSFNKVEMIGSATIGIEGTRGWSYQDLSLLELNYFPKFQSKVLFE